MIERKCVEKTQCTGTSTKLLPRTYFNVLTLSFHSSFPQVFLSFNRRDRVKNEDPKAKLLFSIIVAVKPIYHENSINPTRTILSSSVSNDLMGGTRRRRSCSSTSMIRHDDDPRKDHKNEKQAISDEDSTKQWQQEQQRRHSKNNNSYTYL